jgi:toxin-antitoxin system PIN domain toxin
LILLDVNLLLYAYDPSFERHEKARIWFQEALAGPPQVRLAWVTILAFLRIATNPRAFDRPLSMPEAISTVAGWLDQPSVAVLEAGERHWQILSRLLVDGQARSRLVMDAHLAALAIEHGATFCTSDRDFARFPGLKTLDPLES